MITSGQTSLIKHAIVYAITSEKIIVKVKDLQRDSEELYAILLYIILIPINYA